MQTESASEIDTVFDYHQQTKHHFNRYARSLGYMDWANQPNPFRQFVGAPPIALAHGDPTRGPLYREIFQDTISPEPLNFESISQLFYYSMALSARKQVPGGNGWSLRVNPSSGNLHPTEGYLIIGEAAAPEIGRGVYHYLPYQHALELRRSFERALCDAVQAQIGPGRFLMALSSIYWRESWKYGERAFRYCHHDVGHAIGAIAMAALALGWRAQVIDSLSDEALSALMACDRQEGIEAEHADGLILIDSQPDRSQSRPVALALDEATLSAIQNSPCFGKENPLSARHQPWPIIDGVSEASRKKRVTAPFDGEEIEAPRSTEALLPLCDQRAFQIIRQRRSAVAMDGTTALEKVIFYGMMQRLQPGHAPDFFSVLPWPPQIALFLFVHRVRDLSAGLYVLLRDPSHEGELRKAVKPIFMWEKPKDCPPDLQLYLLVPQDLKAMAKQVSCGQDIAADGAFSFGMLARFTGPICEYGAHFYPRLFWEAGLIGQLCYLEAEAAGIRSTGIGCFFDDVMHDILGIQDQSWQSLYHFTVGGPKEDSRLQNVSAYGHLQQSSNPDS